MAVEFDVVGVSVGGALVSGGLSVFAPNLAALTASLAVLAVAGWLVLLRQARASLRPGRRESSGWAIAAVGVGFTLFLSGVGPLLTFRGLLLGLSLVPLWAVARRFPLGGP